MASADLLILLSDVAGLYDSSPHRNAHAKFLPVVERVTPEIEAMAGGAGSELSRGGMRTKIEAARIATAAGTHMVIADGRIAHPIARIAEGGGCTWFLTPSNPIAARKIWIGGSLELKGAVFVDSGAAAALARGKSLLPAGVTRIEGVFERGDCVAIRNEARVRDRARPHRLRRRARRAHPRPQFARHRAYPRNRGAGRNDPSRRHGARRPVTRRASGSPPLLA